MGKEAITINRDRMIITYCIGMLIVTFGLLAFRYSLRWNAMKTYERNHVARVIKEASMSLEETQYYINHPDEIIGTDRYEEFYEIVTNFYDYYSYGTIFVAHNGAELHVENYMYIKKYHGDKKLFSLMINEIDKNWFCSTFHCVGSEMTQENNEN